MTADPVETVRATARDLAARYGDLLGGTLRRPNRTVVESLKAAQQRVSGDGRPAVPGAQMRFDDLPPAT